MKKKIVWVPEILNGSKKNIFVQQEALMLNYPKICEVSQSVPIDSNLKEKMAKFYALLYYWHLLMLIAFHLVNGQYTFTEFIWCLITSLYIFNYDE